MKSITELRNKNLKVIDELLSGKIAPSTAKEVFNGTGKVTTTLRVEMDYNRMTGKKDKVISFIEGGK